MWNALRRLRRILARDQGSAAHHTTSQGNERPAEYRRLARKLDWGRAPDENGRYLHVFMEQNNTCNLKCTMCGFHDARVAAVPRYYMPTWLFDRIAEQVFPHTTYLHMSLMTEPFMTPDFPERLMRVREHAVPYSRVVTNGTLLTRRTLERVLDSRITVLTFSIDGGTSDVYEAIRIGARFEAVLEKIDQFKDLRAARGAALPRLQINHVLMERNVDSFERFLELVEAIGPEQVDVRTIQPMSFTTGHESNDPGFFEKAARVQTLLATFCERTGIANVGFVRDQAGVIELRAEDGSRMTCRRPWDTLAIHANGDVHPCMSWTRPPVGNLARQSFDEIWNGDELRKLRAEFELSKPGVDCQNCTIKMTVPRGTYDDFFFQMVRKQDEWVQPV